jgi:CheY-like chemotaxis protein
MPELSAMTVMMLTSARHHRDAERCRELGLAAYLYKPIRKQELLSSILLALGQPKTISQSATVTPLAPPALSRGLRILLAEDNRVNQAVAVRMVEKMGHSPVVANNGREALLLLAAKSFDLVLMDVQMPEMDGLKATAMIREKERQTQVHIPIIAMTAHAMKEDRERCLEAGMDGYISKPINGRKLEELIASVFHGLNDKFGASLATQKQDVASDSAITWDIGQTLERLGGDEELFHEVVEIFLEESPKQMSSLRHAIADGNAEDIERTAHSLKGDLGYLGISEVSQKASELEEMGREHNLQHTAEAFATFESGIAGVLLSMREMDGRSLKSS